MIMKAMAMAMVMVMVITIAAEPLLLFGNAPNLPRPKLESCDGDLQSAQFIFIQGVRIAAYRGINQSMC